MIDTQFYLGPLGGMLALPETHETVDTPLKVIGGTHTSLSGRFTRDIYGFKRSWSWKYPALNVAQAQYVEAVQRGMVPGPLYLLDPRRPNRLPEDVSAGGSISGSAVAFLPSNNAICLWRPHHAMDAVSTDTLPAAVMIAGGIEWQIIDVATPAVLEIATSRFGGDGRLDVPVLAGEPLEFNGWFVGAGAVTLSLAFYDRGATQLGPVVTSSGLACDPATWQFTSVDATAPAGAVKARVWMSAATSTTGSLFVSALSLVRTDDPEVVPHLFEYCNIPDPAAGWRIGGGGPQVVPVDTQPSTYPFPGLTSASLTVTER